MRSTRSFFPRPLGILFTVLGIGLLLASCGKKNVLSVPTGPSVANALVLQANASLEAILAGQLTAPAPLRPADLDYTTPDRLYRQALQADPANTGAHFGVAVVGLAALTSDTQVNSAFDSWNGYLQTHTPFKTASSAARPLGIPSSLRSDLGGIQLPFEIVPLSLVANLRATRATVDPRLSLVQDVLSQKVMPRLAESVAHLNIALADPNFEFRIPTSVQTGTPGSYRLVHHTDLLAFRASAELLQAACGVATAYNVDFASYDSTGIVAALTPGSGWLALATGGATRLSDARTQMFASIADAEAALAALRSQTGNHDFDLIKIPPGPRGQQQADSLQADLERARLALTSGFKLKADWDNNPSTPDVELTVRADRLLTNPVADWKALLPAYTIAVAPVATRTVLNSVNGTSGQGAIIPAPGFYSATYQAVMYPGGLVWSSFYGSDSLRTPLVAAAAQESLRVSALPGFSGEYNIFVSFSGTLAQGAQTIQVAWSDYYPLVMQQAYIPKLTWNAPAVASWSWPDPTMGGTLPDMTSSDVFVSTLGLGGGAWSRSVVLDWTGSGLVW